MLPVPAAQLCRALFGTGRRRRGVSERCRGTILPQGFEPVPSPALPSLEWQYAAEFLRAELGLGFGFGHKILRMLRGLQSSCETWLAPAFVCRGYHRGWSGDQVGVKSAVKAR